MQTGQLMMADEGLDKSFNDAVIKNVLMVTHCLTFYWYHLVSGKTTYLMNTIIIIGCLNYPGSKQESKIMTMNLEYIIKMKHLTYKQVLYNNGNTLFISLNGGIGDI